LNQDKKQIARVAAHENGNYRVVLPPGDYVLKVQERTRTHLRCKPTTIHDCVESDCPRRYGYYCGGPVASWIDAIVPIWKAARFPLKPAALIPPTWYGPRTWLEKSAPAAGSPPRNFQSAAI